MINKHVICRASVATILLVVISGFIILYGATILGAIISTLSGIISTLSGITIDGKLFENIAWGIIFLGACIPLVLINTAWKYHYNGELTRDDCIFVAFFTLLIGGFDFVVPALALYANKFVIWQCIPIVLIVINLTFILLYYTAGKKTCKLIYGGKAE